MKGVEGDEERRRGRVVGRRRSWLDRQMMPETEELGRGRIIMRLLRMRIRLCALCSVLCALGGGRSQL